MDNTIMYLSKKIALTVHKELIKDFGGESGNLDEAKLVSCLIQPTTTYYNQEQYPTIVEKAAVYLYAVVTLQPFMDGNKRAGYTYAQYFLKSLGYSIETSTQEKICFVMDVASNNKTLEQVIDWVKTYTDFEFKTTKQKFSSSIKDFILHDEEDVDWAIYEEIRKTDNAVLKKLAE